MDREGFKPTEGVYLLLDPHTDARSPCVTTRPHSYENETFSLTVPTDFRCDFASVPRCMLWFFGTFERHQRAALFHDAAYRYQGCSRFQADALFRMMLRADGVGFVKRCLLYYAVRFGGWIAWRRNAKHVAQYRFKNNL